MIVLDVEKQPWERKLYKVSHSLWLPPTVTVVSATVASIVCLNVPADVALTNDAPLIIATPFVQVWINLGTDACKYKVTIRAICSDSSQVESEIIVRVRDY